MVPHVRSRLGDETGFSLIELLVVILIVGLLAALAIPQFLGQKQNAEDGSAKSDARNLAHLVEACATEGGDYGDCDSAAELPRSGLELGAGPGQVSVTDAKKTSFEVTAKSKSGNQFVWERAANGAITRSCSPANAGGCKSAKW